MKFHRKIAFDDSSGWWLGRGKGTSAGGFWRSSEAVSAWPGLARLSCALSGSAWLRWVQLSLAQLGTDHVWPSPDPISIGSAWLRSVWLSAVLLSLAQPGLVWLGPGRFRPALPGWVPDNLETPKTFFPPFSGNSILMGHSHMGLVWDLSRSNSFMMLL